MEHKEKESFFQFSSSASQLAEEFRTLMQRGAEPTELSAFLERVKNGIRHYHVAARPLLSTLVVFSTGL